jgi:hypothetical protein
MTGWATHRWPNRSFFWGRAAGRLAVWEAQVRRPGPIETNLPERRYGGVCRSTELWGTSHPLPARGYHLDEKR